MISRSRAAVVAPAVLACLLAVLAVAGWAPATAVAAPTTAVTTTAPATDAAVAATASADAPVVIAGVAGLEWSDLDPSRTPNLWRLVATGDVASISVRTGVLTCPVDAWLTVSAGNRVVGAALPAAGAQEDTTSIDDATDLRCRPVPVVDAAGDTGDADAEPVIATSATVRGWDTLTAEDTAATGSFGRPGTLGDALSAAGVCSTAIGRGGALALAEGSGHVGRYLPAVPTDAAALTAELTACPVAVVDLGQLPDQAAERADALREVDTAVGRLDNALPDAGRLLVAGIADTPLGQRGLQVAIERGHGASPAWLSSGSARREGVVVVNDLAATVATAAGLDVSGFDGWALERGEQRGLDARDTVDNRQYLTTLTETTEPMSFAVLGLIGVLAVLAVTAFIRRRATHLARATLTVAAFLPAAASLATLSRWWTSAAPGPVLAAAVAVPAVVLALAVWALDAPARRVLPDAVWRRPTLVAALTWVVLTTDGLTGTTLQQGSPLGSSLALGARFYGFGNTVFSVYSVAALVLAAGAAQALRAHRRAAVTVAAAIGLVTVVINGLPSLGADAGGIVAQVPAFAVLVLLLSGRRVRPRHWVLVGAVTLAAVAAIAVAAWLVPGGSHLGRFVQRLVDGDAVAVVASKAAGALATVSHVPGALAAVAAVVIIWAALSPGRRPWTRLAPLAATYRSRPVLHALVVALAVVTVVGSVLNDTGVGVAVVILLVTAATLGTGGWRAAPRPTTATDPGTPDEPDPLDQAHAPGRDGEPRLIVTVGSGVLLVFLMATGMVPPSAATDQAGAATTSSPTAPESVIATPNTPLVIIGTSGLRWEDLDPDEPTAPQLARLLADGADAGGVALPTGRSARCQEGGWLALSAGQLTEVATERVDGAWACPVLDVIPHAAGGASLQAWDDLVALQQGSSLGARLGRVGDLLAHAPACATAVGPGAGAALADTAGTIARYRTLDEALTFGSDAFDCAVTVVDAGAVDPAEDRAAQVAAIDLAAARTLAAAPDDAQVVVVDVGQTSGRPDLGIALARPVAGSDDRPRFLSSTATRTEGVARLLDLPATMLDAVGVAVPSPLDDTPLVRAGIRPPDTGATADELADVTTRDHVRRAAYASFVDYPFYLALAVAAACWVVGARARRRGTTPRAALHTLAHGVSLLLAALPAAAFLGGLTGWWRFEDPGLALLAGTVLTTVTVAALATLAPRDPAWARPAIIAGITFVVLTLDGILGTPLNRTSPVGSAPTFGARFFGFGNPTFSIYAVAGLVFAGALAQLCVRGGRRRLGALVVGVLGTVTMAVNVWPTFGADLGGGLVLVPAFVLVGFGALGARVTFRRFVLVAAAGVAAVAAVGVLDWLRPAAERSHLGRFVDQVVNGEAWTLLARKAWFAAQSILGGATVWLTVVILLAAALALFAPPGVRARFTPGWLTRTEEQWPLVRPTLLALWVVAMVGSVVNDFGLRIAMIALIPAVPLILLAALSAARSPVEPPAPRRTHHGSAGR